MKQAFINKINQNNFLCLSDHNWITLQINNKRKYRNYKNMYEVLHTGMIKESLNTFFN